MSRSIKILLPTGFVISSIVGTLLHFAYEKSGNSLLVAPFSGVNESTWEHMKLLFWPMLIFSLFECFFIKDRRDFWCIKLRGILLGLCLIPVIFYTYNGVIGRSPDWVNISIFFISAALSYIYQVRLFEGGRVVCKYKLLPKIVLCIILVMFVVFTFFPPHIEIFKDPVTEKYGI